MGLASSQARLLNLTSRMHQIEYGAARLEAMKLQMANESRQVYLEYQDALEQSKIQVKTLTTDGSATYRDLTNYADFIAAGFALVYNNEVYDGTDGKTFNDLVAKIIDASNANAGAAAGTATGGTTGGTGTTVNIADGVSFEKALTNMINSGYVTIIQKDPNYTENNGFHIPSDSDVAEQLKFTDFETSVATNTGLQEVTDETNLRKAEAKYEADMKRIDMKDRKYDYDLAALEQERNAIKQEMETLKTVAKDNVERTFKLFS